MGSQEALADSGPAKEKLRRSIRVKASFLKPLGAMSTTTVAKTTTAKASKMPSRPAEARKRKAPAASAPAAKKAKTSDSKAISAPVAKTTKPAPSKTKKAAVKKEPKKPAAETPKPAAAAPAKKRKALESINDIPSKKMKVYVFGEGSNGELGLGAQGNVIDVKRPRLNPHLSPDDVGIVQLSAGGMHVAALTHDNKIITWGVNDQGALGRDTNYEGAMRDMDGDASDAGSDNGLNAVEAMPAAADVQNVPEGTKFSSVVCGDSVTFAVTDTGLVYGCGTFRSSEGILGFSPTVQVQKTFAQVEGLKDIVSVACGANHALALDKKGNVFSWGSGQQMQLGRRIVERNRMRALVPSQFGLPRNKIRSVSSGAYHSFAIDIEQNVWSWGLNSFGETGINVDVGKDEAVVIGPKKVEELVGKQIKVVEGGAHHSIAADASGQVWAFGRADASQSGLDVQAFARDHPDDVVLDDKMRPRIIATPAVVPGLSKVTELAVGIDTTIAVDEEGKAHSWGFSTNYQTGLGTEDDVSLPTLIANTAVRDEHIVYAGAGGQFGMLASYAK